MKYIEVYDIGTDVSPVNDPKTPMKVIGIKINNGVNSVLYQCSYFTGGISRNDFFIPDELIFPSTTPRGLKIGFNPKGTN